MELYCANVNVTLLKRGNVESMSCLHCISDFGDNIELSNNRMLVICVNIAHKYSQISTEDTLLFVPHLTWHQIS